MAHTQTERDGQGIALRFGKPVEPAHHRHAQLVQPGERQLHLRLDTGRPQDLTPGRALHQVLDEGGFADSGLTAENQYLAPALSGAGDHVVQGPALAVPPSRRTPRSTTARHAHHHRSRSRP